jgi:WD40 repeat protein
MVIRWLKITFWFGFLVFGVGQAVFAQDALQPLMWLAGESAIWSADGVRILTHFNAPQDCGTVCPHQVRIADVSGDSPVYSLVLEFNRAVREVQWNADESLILVWTRDFRCTERCNDVLSVWESATGNEVVSMDGLGINGYGSIGWTGEFFYLLQYAYTNGTGLAFIRVWNAAGEEIFTYEPEGFYSAHWNGDYLLMRVSSENSLNLWNVRENTQVWTFDSEMGSLGNTLWHPDGERFGFVYEANGAFHVDIRDLVGELLDTLTLAGVNAFPSIVWSSDGTRLLIRANNMVSVWDVESGERLFEYQAEVLFDTSWDGEHLLLLADGVVTIYDAQTFDMLLTFTPMQNEDFLVMGYSGYIEWNADHSLLLVGAPHDVNSTQREITSVWSSEGEFVAFIGDMFFADVMPRWSPTSNRLVGVRPDEAKIYVWELEG